MFATRGRDRQQQPSTLLRHSAAHFSFLSVVGPLTDGSRPTQAIPKRPQERRMTLKPVLRPGDGLTVDYASFQAVPKVPESGQNQPYFTQKECRMPKAMLRPRRGDWPFTKDVCANANSLSKFVPRT